MCGCLFTARTERRVCCSTACTTENQSSAVVTRRIMERYQNDPQFRDRVLSAAHNRRASKLGLGTAAVTLTYLMDRDSRRCGICHQPVRAKTGPMRASIDHIVPLSRGGDHALSNVQLSHYRCNLAKNNGGHGEQLLLIG